PGLPTHVGVGDVTVAVAEPLRGGILRPQPVRSAKIRNTGSGRQARPGQRRHPTGVREQLTSSLPLDRRVRAAFCHASTLPCLGRTWGLTSKPHRIVRYTIAVGVGTRRHTHLVARPLSPHSAATPPPHSGSTRSPGCTQPPSRMRQFKPDLLISGLNTGLSTSCSRYLHGILSRPPYNTASPTRKRLPT